MLYIVRLFVILSIFTFMSMAEKGQAQDVYGTLKQKLRITDAKARVTQIVDGETIIINNNETLHLPMLYIPTEARGGENAMAAAKAYLDQTLNGKFITIFQVRNNERALQNALGHTEAYVMANGVFIQQDMIARGLAFAYPSPSHNVIADMLYQAEAKARDDEIGLWSSKDWQVLSEEEVKGVNNRFVIVEGRIEKVATKKNVIYLNFERDWKKDFTVAISSDLRRDFSKANKSVMQLGRKAVRVRGWVRDYNGPYMEVMHPSQVEIISVPKSERKKQDEEGAAQDAIDEALLKEWGLNSMRNNNIAPKSPMIGDAANTNRPYAVEPLKPVVPTPALTTMPTQAKSPAAEIPQGVKDAQKSSYDLMDRGLLDQNAGPEQQ